MEVLLSVLEAKLNSVPMLQDISAPTDPALEAKPASSTPSAPAADGTTNNISVIPVPEGETPAAASNDIPEEYRVLEKMLKVGVPMPVVQAKATTIGLDPAVVERIAANL